MAWAQDENQTEKGDLSMTETKAVDEVETQDDESAAGGDAVSGVGAAQNKTIGAALGEMVWLLTQSPRHRYALFLADLEWLLMPPLQHGQYRLFYANGRPIGFTVWAYVGDRAESRLTQGGRIAAQEWRSGPKLWLVELVAPFGNQEHMLQDLRTNALAGQRLHYLRTNSDGSREVVASDPSSAEP